MTKVSLAVQMILKSFSAMETMIGFIIHYIYIRVDLYTELT